MNSNIVDSVSRGPGAPRVSPRRLLILCAAALAAGWGLARWLDERGAASYGGSLQSLTTTITADRDARIQEIVLAPGQRVVPGDKLLQLSDDRLASRIADQRSQLTELEADLKRVQAKADVELEWRKRELNGEIFQTQMKLSAVAQERTARQVEQLAWQDHLKSLPADATGPEVAEVLLPIGPRILDAPFSDQRRLQAILREDAAAIAAEALSAQLALCEQQLERLRKIERELLEKVRVSVGVDVVETRLARARQDLESLEKQRESLTVISPAHGIVGAIHHRAGDVVSAGDPIVELLDDQRRHLTACIPSGAATKLRVGTKVELVFPGRQNRIGLVAAIPPHATPASQASQVSDSQVLVKVEPAGKLWPQLPIGSSVQVRVIQ